MGDVSVGQVRRGDDGTIEVAVVCSPGRFMVSDHPLEIAGPYCERHITEKWPNVVGVTDEPGKLKEHGIPEETGS